jgi:hypothetical protein
MKRLEIFGVLLLGLTASGAGEVTATNDTEAAQWQKIYERFRADGITNVEEMMKIPIFRAIVVHPAFGIASDEVPPPTLTNSSAMASVSAFIATNGWSMHTDSLGPFAWVKNQKPIRGLPWKEIEDREFPATTHNGILYVKFTGWHYNDHGVAFNPKTNRFPKSILGFKALANHWYVWAQRDDSLEMAQVYEGQKIGEPDGPADGSQPIRSETNRTSSAAGSRR